ncbi:hypothetical protein EUGRSUZ_A02654 [Eucalyptus grandis]|uniref:Uncharacterized protein n=2 Tax=Eucalyptus grandis TaxID=71139 RepID=A0ACC3M6Q8_EUCGR|nr:hypothetical protein EUGRSUZ_A02654 [Eucalyptus grandis]
MILFRRVVTSAMNAVCFQRTFAAAASPLVPVQLPSRMEAHLWYVVPDEVKSSSLLHDYFDILSPCEKENVSRKRGEQLQKAALLARALVRTTIARYQINGQVDPRSLKFKKNIHGKPELEWNDNPCQSASRLQFNISHTSSLILCGVTVDSPIGVDLEEKQRKLKNDILAFARRYFTPHEVKFLSSISDPGVQHQYFVKLWTLKESYVKALGRGFSGLPFKMFTIQFGNAEKGDSCISGETNNEGEIIVKSLEHVNSVSSNWQFALLELAGSHYAAICMEKDEAVEGRVPTPMKLTVRKTIPYMRDEFISGPDAVVISGLT